MPMESLSEPGSWLRWCGGTGWQAEVQEGYWEVAHLHLRGFGAISQSLGSESGCGPGLKPSAPASACTGVLTSLGASQSPCCLPVESALPRRGSHRPACRKAQSQAEEWAWEQEGIREDGESSQVSVGGLLKRKMVRCLVLLDPEVNRNWVFTDWGSICLPLSQTGLHTSAS